MGQYNLTRIDTNDPIASGITKAIVNDICYLGGLQKENFRGKKNNALNGDNYLLPAILKPACKKICDLIKYRDFDNINTEINQIAEATQGEDKGIIAPATGGALAVKSYSDLACYNLDPEDIATSLAMLCATFEIYWETSKRTPYEMEEFIQNTIFGNALALYECFNIDEYNNVNYTADGKDAGVENDNIEDELGLDTNTPTSNSATTTNATKKAPQNNYKSQGPQSANVRDLKGQPGQKEKLSNPVYMIVGINDKSKTNKAHVFIKPLEEAGKVGNTNKICFGSANNYMDCILYFNDKKIAEDFLLKVEPKAPANIRGLEVAQIQGNLVSKMGFYKVGTEFGDAYINAKKLNEAAELVEENLDKPIQTTKTMAEELEERSKSKIRTEEEWIALRQYLSDAQKYYN